MNRQGQRASDSPTAHSARTNQGARLMGALWRMGACGIAPGSCPTWWQAVALASTLNLAIQQRDILVQSTQQDARFQDLILRLFQRLKLTAQ